MTNMKLRRTLSIKTAVKVETLQLDVRGSGFHLREELIIVEAELIILVMQ